MATSWDYHGDYQERYPKYANTPDQTESAPPSAQPGMGTPSYKVPCESPQGHNESDLCAQWRAANGAKEGARWGLWQLLASVVGIIGLGVTLWFNKRAIDLALEGGEDTERALIIAERNADTAAAHVEIAQDTAYRELRAYLSVETVKPNEVQAGGISGNIVIRNAGQTPAAVRVYFETSIQKFPLTDARIDGPPPSLHNQIKPFINRGSDEAVFWWFPKSGTDPAVRATAIAKATDEIAQLCANPMDRCFYLYGRIEFTDYLRRERVLHFQFRTAGFVKIGQTFEMMTMPTGNEYEDRSKSA